MKKSKGFIDPITLGFLVSLGLAGAGVAADKNSDSQKTMAQDTEIQTELVVPAQKEPNT
jgi:hypothetical protein